MEVFLDAMQLKLIQLRLTELAVADLQTGRIEHFGSVPQEIASNLLGASASPDNDYLIFHREPKILEYISLFSGKVFRQKVKQKAPILGYHWSADSSDLVLITTGGVRFYRLEADSGRLKKLAMYLFKVKQYWVERGAQLLLLQESQHTNILRTYSFRFPATAAASLFEGKRYTLDAPPTITSHLLNAHAGSQSLHSLTKIADLHHAVLVRLYETLYFVHYQDHDSKLFVYQLPSAGGTVSCQMVKLEDDCWEFLAVDSLLLGRSVETQRVCCVDIRQPATLTIQGAQDQPAPAPSTSAQSLLPFDFQLPGVPIQGACARHFLVASPTLLVHVDTCEPYRLDLSPRELAAQWGGAKAQFSFLLRRAGMKSEALKFLRFCLLQPCSLVDISHLFHILSKIYVSALQEEQDESQEELRLKDGTCVLSQKEVFEKVLLDVYEAYEKQQKRSFVTAVLLEFMRQFQARGVRVTSRVQQLLAKNLIAAGDFALLQHLLTREVFNDLQEVSLLLLTAARCSNQAACVALDVLWQLRDRKELTYLCLERGYLYELMRTLEAHPYDLQCAQVLERFTKECSQHQVVLAILDFLETWRLANQG